MALDALDALKQQYELLNTLYDQNLHAVKQLQRTLEHEILPGLVDEEGWDEDDVEYALEWLRDTPSVFRILKRQKFTASLALEALRTTLLWRIQTLQPLACEPPTAYFTCLPPDARDPFGRPIVIVQAAKIVASTENLKELTLCMSELMRLHLVHLNKEHSYVTGARPILQYVALFDIGDLSLNSMQAIDLMNWHVQELLPRFPGMLAAVLILNYSWAHSGVWGIAKRLLPKSALQKVFFLSPRELRQLLSAGVLPKEYGGDLPPIAELPNALRPHAVAAHTKGPAQTGRNGGHPDAGDAEGPAAAVSDAAAPARTVLSSTSLLNPFFGYPAVYDATATPALRHGRRRKRDLLYTLARLWWARWGTRTVLTLALLALLLAIRRWRSPLRLIFDRRRPVARAVRAFLPANAMLP